MRALAEQVEGPGGHGSPVQRAPGRVRALRGARDGGQPHEVPLQECGSLTFHQWRKETAELAGESKER